VKIEEGKVLSIHAPNNFGIVFLAIPPLLANLQMKFLKLNSLKKIRTKNIIKLKQGKMEEVPIDAIVTK